MALLHQATISPRKDELVGPWLPTRPWWDGDRGASLPGAESGLVGTMEHSVLGTRFVHDACTDPVFVATVLDVIRAGGRHADLVVRRADGTEVVREPDRTTITGADVELTVMRQLGAGPEGPALTGGFEGGTGLRLAVVTGGAGTA